MDYKDHNYNDFLSNNDEKKEITLLNVDEMVKQGAISFDMTNLSTLNNRKIKISTEKGVGNSGIFAGKTNFNNDDNGFALGVDDSDSKTKFYIGNSSSYFNWDGTDVKLACSGENAIEIDYGSDILLKHGGDIKFTSVDAPTACIASLITGSGSVDAGTHKYKITYVNETGETNLGEESNTITTDATHGQVKLTNIPISSSSSVIWRKIYRTKAGGSSYYHLATIYDKTTTTYTDNIADSSLGITEYSSKENDTFGKIINDGTEVFSISDTNILIGKQAGYFNGAGNDKIFLGNKAGYSDSSNYECIFIGSQSGYSETNASREIFIGKSAGYTTNGGIYNIFIGDESGYKNTTGKGNILIGDKAGYNITTETYNLMMGRYTGLLATGSYNVLLGNLSADSGILGDDNTFVGYASGRNNAGSDNVFLGCTSGYYETGSNKLFIDNQARTNEATARTNAMIYGEFNGTPTSQKLYLNSAVIIGTTSALSTSATDGFLNIPTCAGAPTGTPTAYTGKVAMVYDTTNNDFYIYNGAWKKVGLT